MDSIGTRIHAFFFGDDSSVSKEAETEQAQRIRQVAQSVFSLIQAVRNSPSSPLKEAASDVSYAVRLLSNPARREQNIQFLMGLKPDDAIFLLKQLPREEKRALLMGQEDLAEHLRPQIKRPFKDKEDKDLQGDELQLKIALQKGMLNSDIGYEGEPAGGANGARYVCDAFAPKGAGKGADRIAVFKPVQKKMDLLLSGCSQISSLNYPEMKLGIQKIALSISKAWKQYILGQAKLTAGGEAKYEQERELDATRVSKALGFCAAPETTWAKLSSSEGSLSLYLGDHFLASDKGFDTKLNTEEGEASIKLEELTVIQKAFVFNFLIGDLDGKRENWMIKTANRNTNGEIVGIRFIDSGNAFPYKTTWNPLITHNQFEWGRLKVSQKKFTSETIKFIEDLDDKTLETVLRGMIERLPQQGRKDMLLRLKFLKTQTKENTPAQLAEMKSHDEKYEEMRLRTTQKTLSSPPQVSASAHGMTAYDLRNASPD